MKLLLNFHEARCFACGTLLAILASTSIGCATNGRDGSYSSHNKDNTLLITSNSYSPPEAKTLYAMSRILVAQGKDDQSELVLERLNKEYPKFIPAYCDLAELRMRQGRVADAVVELNKGLEVAPHDPILLNNMGVCSIFRGDYADALYNFTLAAEVMPREDRYRANMALALGMLGRYEEALNLYKEVLDPALAAENMTIINDMFYESIDSSL